MTDAPDEDLLAAYATGDRAAARVLTARHLPRVLAQAIRRLGDRDEAEDVAQEAMVRLWKIAPDWRRGEAQVSTWLYRVAANLAIDRLRRRGRAVDIDAVPEPEDEKPGAEAAMQTEARMVALYEALGALPERQRKAVVLRHIEGRANPEIAREMDMSVEAVESLTARGKRRLAEILRGRKDELGLADDG